MGRKPGVESVELRGRILDMTEEIIRNEDISKLTMRGLAKRLNLSPTTPYNMFGSKGSLLKEVLVRDAINDSISLGIIPSPDDTLDVIFGHIDLISGQMTSKSGFIKTLFHGIIQQEDVIDLKAISEMSQGIAFSVVDMHIKRGIIPVKYDSSIISALIVESVLSQCFLWLTCVVPDEKLGSRLKRAIASVLYDHASPEHQPALLEYLMIVHDFEVDLVG